MEQVMRNMLKVQVNMRTSSLIKKEDQGERISIYNMPENEEGSLMITFVETLLRDKLDGLPTTELQISPEKHGYRQTQIN